ECSRPVASARGLTPPDATGILRALRPAVHCRPRYRRARAPGAPAGPGRGRHPRRRPPVLRQRRQRIQVLQRARWPGHGAAAPLRLPCRVDHRPPQPGGAEARRRSGRGNPHRRGRQARLHGWAAPAPRAVARTGLLRWRRPAGPRLPPRGGPCGGPGQCPSVDRRGRALAHPRPRRRRRGTRGLRRAAGRAWPCARDPRRTRLARRAPGMTGWRTLLGAALLVAAIATGWSAWKMRGSETPSQAGGQRSDYVLRDFDLVVLGKDGSESVRVQAPELQRREDESMDLREPVFLAPAEPGPWRLSAERGWISPDGELLRLDGNVAGDSDPASPAPTRFRTSSMELLPSQDLA